MKELTLEELENLKNRLNRLELQLLTHYGLDKLNGGFVTSQMYDYDDKVIEVEVLSGISGEDMTTEIIQLNRETLEIIK